MSTFLRGALLVFPMVCLLGAAFLLPLAVPETADFQAFVSSGLEGIPFFTWSVLGVILGAALSFIRGRWPRQTVRYGSRALLGLGAWLMFGLVLSMFIGEGSYLDRLRGSMIIGSWGITVWVLLCTAPTALGVHSLLYRSALARGATVLTFLFIALSGLVYAQASEVRVAQQDPYLSLGFIIAVVGFLEGMNWKQRYLVAGLDPEVGRLLLARQVGFTMVFTGVGAVLAMVPFLVGDVPRAYYESTAVLGKAILGLALLTPLAIIAMARNLLDR